MRRSVPFYTTHWSCCVWNLACRSSALLNYSINHHDGQSKCPLLLIRGNKHFFSFSASVTSIVTMAERNTDQSAKTMNGDWIDWSWRTQRLSFTQSNIIIIHFSTWWFYVRPSSTHLPTERIKGDGRYVSYRCLIPFLSTSIPTEESIY